MACAGAEVPPPNVVLIMADDVGYECFGCYGSQQYHTPNIDSLADQGLRFTHCYAQPLCTPSRVKLMTGLSNVRNYSAFSVLNRDQTTIGQYFQQLGYETLITGKWQLLGASQYAPRFRQQGTWPQDAGFDKYCLWQVDELGSRYWEPRLYQQGENRQYGPDEYGPDICTRVILDFLRQPHDRPFFVYYPMILVHNPFEPTPASASRASQDRQQNFEDMVHYMDHLVGLIVGELTSLGLAENTLLLFTGDNGTNRSITSQLNGRVIQGGKGTTTDAGTRVPLVAYQPGTVPAGRTCDDLVDFSDFLPTLLSAAQGTVPTGLDGHSFWQQLQGLPGTPRESLFCYYCPRPEKTPPVRFARDKRWKLYDDGRFYDVDLDPLELVPLQIDATTSNDVRGAHRRLTAVIDSMPSTGRTLLRFSPSSAEPQLPHRK